jgi:signal transduction histidine kinase
MFALLYALLRRGSIRTVLVGLVLTLAAYGVAATVTCGSVRGTTIYAFVGAAVAGGIFFGRDALVATGAACLACVGALIFAENAGWLGAHPDAEVGLIQWIDHSVVLILIAVNIGFARLLAVGAPAFDFGPHRFPGGRGRAGGGSPERQVRVDIAPGLNAQCVPALARILLDNLLGNARKFTGSKEGAVIEFGAQQIDGEQVFFVRDNGAGFGMKYAQKLFSAFQRMHRRDEYPGSGIGLVMVQRIVSRHGGRAWAEAESGRGATFRFTLGKPD